MTELHFKPGFIMSLTGGAVLFLGGLATYYFGRETGWVGFVIVMVILHFFLFCNVFRIARASELLWAGFFLVSTGATILTGEPGWTPVAACSVSLSVYLIRRATRSPSYHGICWRRWNPDLEAWWRTRRGLDKKDTIGSRGSSP